MLFNLWLTSHKFAPFWLAIAVTVRQHKLCVAANSRKNYSVENTELEYYDMFDIFNCRNNGN